MTDTPTDPTDSDNVIDACSAALPFDQGAAPGVLYHLTDSAGLRGIVEKKALWASLATALNDDLEVAHGVSVAMKLLEERLRSRWNLYEVALLTYLRDPSTAPATDQLSFDPFVVSFCGRCDKSGQWLHYGRSGRGVALGFSPAIAEAVGYDLIKVDYGVVSQRKRMDRLIDIGLGVLAAGSQAITRNENVTFTTAHIVALHVPLLAIRMKHLSFSEEEEWRLIGHLPSLNGRREDVTGDETPLKFRSSGERMIPYEEISFASGASTLLNEIVLGYSSVLTVDAVRLLAQEARMNPRVLRSSVPVR